jgi:hypothetical protein
LLSTSAYLFTLLCSSLVRMAWTKNVSSLGGGDDEDPPRPFWQVKEETVYLEQQEGRKKCNTPGVTIRKARIWT